MNPQGNTRACFSFLVLWFALTVGPLLLSGCAVTKRQDRGRAAETDRALTAIVVAPGSIPAEDTATKELAAYLEKITGRSFPVVQESELAAGSTAIYLGWTKYARKAGINGARLADEEWIIRSVNGNLVLTGGRPRGTLYAVYHFLEDDLGVRWWTPHAESVPRRPELRPGLLDRRGKPVFAYRDIYLVGGNGAVEFCARNRLSHHLPQYGARIRFGGPVDCHTLYRFLGTSDEVKKLYQEHPEWFPLLDGVRKLDPVRQDGGAQTQLCLSNPALRKHFVECVRRFIKEDNAKAARQGLQPPLFYAIDQNDAYDGFCKCARCLAIVEREGAVSGLMLEFTNDVAGNLKDETDAMFLMMAEHVLERPPQSIRPLANVGLRLCDTTSNMIHPWTHPDNARHRLNLDGWSKIFRQIVIWDYSIHYGGEFAGINLPFPNARTFAPDLRYLAAHKGYGVFFEHEEWLRGDLRDLKIWLEAKLAENPFLDDGALLTEFTDGFYGPAGQPIRQYLALLEKAADQAGAKLTYFPGAAAFTYLDGDFMIPAMRIFDAAEHSVGADAERLQRVRQARLSLDRAFLLKANALKAGWRKQGNADEDFPIDPEQVLARYQRTWQDACEQKFPVALAQFAPLRDEERKNHEKFLEGFSKRKNLPIPEPFKEVPPGRLYDFNAHLFSTWVNYWKMVPDPGTVVGGALRATGQEILSYARSRPEYGISHFRSPFAWAVYPTAAGDIKGTTELPVPQKDGYNWYRLGSTFKLLKDSALGLFIGLGVNLESVVADNSDIGQEYEIWISMKIAGPAFSLEGLPGPDNSFSIDRAIVIQKTSNREEN